MPAASGLGRARAEGRGYCFATDRVGLAAVLQRGGASSTTRRSSTRSSTASTACRARSWTPASRWTACSSRYQGVDWTDPASWDLNDNRHPSRAGAYGGVSIQPFEVAFHKWYWSDQPDRPVAGEYVERYMRWKLDELRGPGASVTRPARSAREWRPRSAAALAAYGARFHLNKVGEPVASQWQGGSHGPPLPPIVMTASPPPPRLRAPVRVRGREPGPVSTGCRGAGRGGGAVPPVEARGSASPYRIAAAPDARAQAGVDAAVGGYGKVGKERSSSRVRRWCAEPAPTRLSL